MESIFKYIFTMIVGAMFLIFFVGFAYKYMGVTETVNANVLVRSFDDYLLSLTATEESSKDARDFSAVTTISFEKGKIKSGSTSTETNRIIFAPKTLTGKKIATRTMRWSFPYQVDNFFYITNEKYKQIIVYDDTSKDYVQELMEDINKTFDIRAFSKTELNSNIQALGRQYQPMSRVTFLLVSNGKWDETTKNKIRRAIPKAVFIWAKGEGINDEEPTDETAKWRHGTIHFEEDEAPYLEKEMLIGALYAEDYENYNFNFGRAMKRLSAISEIYLQKAESLQNSWQNNGCEDAIPIINGIKEIYDSTKDGLPDNIQQIEGLAARIDEINKRNIGGYGCPFLF